MTRTPEQEQRLAVISLCHAMANKLSEIAKRIRDGEDFGDGSKIADEMEAVFAEMNT